MYAYLWRWVAPVGRWSCVVWVQGVYGRKRGAECCPRRAASHYMRNGVAHRRFEIWMGKDGLAKVSGVAW